MSFATRLDRLISDLENSVDLKEKHHQIDSYYIDGVKVERKRRLEAINWVKNPSRCRIAVRLSPKILIWLDNSIGFGDRSAFIRHLLLALIENKEHRANLLKASKFGKQLEESEQLEEEAQD